MLHPITFSISASKVIDTIPTKTKLVSSLIPGNTSTYIYSTETDYYNEYRQSMFATTTKKGGWDCMRHYEILANGSIPYFPNLEACPPNTMALLPKSLILEGNRLYESYKSYTSIDQLTEKDTSDCTSLIQKLLDYTREYLTTKAMASYVLQKSNSTTATRVLYLSQNPTPDYLRCVTLHGFKELLGVHCHDFPKVPHIYKTNTINYKNLYGKGITYTNLLDPSLHREEWDSSVQQDIRDKKYDIIVYGSYHRGMPFYDLVCSIYKPNEVILLCGEDIHSCNYSTFVNRGHTVFVREL